MKFQVICEKCNTVVELVPKTNGQHANIQEINGLFTLSEIEIDNDVEADLNDSFIEMLSKNNNINNVRNILENDISDNVEVDKELKEIRIDCKKCGNYIVLNNFPNHIYR